MRTVIIHAFPNQISGIKAKEKFPHAITLNEDLSFDASQGCKSDISVNKVVHLVYVLFWSNAVCLNNPSDVHSSTDQGCVSQNHRNLSST